jgi:para-aminobenzoate synthetase component 1
LKRLVESLRPIATVHTQPLSLEEPFPEMVSRFAQEPGTVALLSGGDLDCSRFHILCLRPWLTLEGWSQKTMAVVDGQTIGVSKAPLDVLETVLSRCRLTGPDIAGPIAAGLFGYLAYDLKDGLETLPRTSIDDLELPLLYLSAPSLIIVQDKGPGTTLVHAPVRQKGSVENAQQSIDAFKRALKRPIPTPGNFSAAGQPLTSNVTRSEYVRAVQQIREYIAAGDVYQVNMSQRFETGFSGDSYGLFKKLYALNPAPFFAYVNAGSHQIVSTSPERFLLRDGRRVETRPIKGTRPRGKTPDEDLQMKTALSESPKDDAELSMIVDLLRNDIGKVCTGGSVSVAQHKRLEAYQNVYHLVSVVEGELAKGKNAVDLIRATFPGGSITGCPKIRSMEIIDELESRRRHVYTGSIGYISFHDTMDLSIAIRTAVIVGNRLVFSVGGGIVFDSDPEDEFEETLHKGRTLMSVFKGTAAAPTEQPTNVPWVWQNGRLIPQDEAVVPITDLGLQYGFGFFETIRFENEYACHLSAHLKRFNRTWSRLFPCEPPDLTWKDIIEQVIEQNGLVGKTAAVKILATRGNPESPGENGTLLVTARPYTHRLTARGSQRVELATYPPRQNDAACGP